MKQIIIWQCGFDFFWFEGLLFGKNENAVKIFEARRSWKLERRKIVLWSEGSGPSAGF